MRRRSQIVGPSNTVIQSAVVTETGSYVPGRIITGRTVSQWAFDTGPFAGQDPIAVLGAYLSKLENDLLPAAEAMMP